MSQHAFKTIDSIYEATVRRICRIERLNFFRLPPIIKRRAIQRMQRGGILAEHLSLEDGNALAAAQIQVQINAMP